jgi:GNAT superfamily N-acetyltransferase
MGHVSLRRRQAPSASFTGEVTLDVDARYRDAGIGPLLMAAALEWASEQPGLEKV